MERNTMKNKISIVGQLNWMSFARFTALVLLGLFLGSSFMPALAQQPGQRTFTSREEASRALFAALQAQDEQSPLSILGPGGKDVLSSGDSAEDSDARVGFVVKY